MTITIQDVKSKLAEYNARVTEFVERYRQDDDHVYYEVGEVTYVMRVSNFGFYYDRPTASEPDIIAFEKTHNIELPEDYRSFLLEIADGGDDEKTPGPWLYLYPFQFVQTRLDSDPAKPFPYTDRLSMGTNPVDDIYDAYHMNGTINIGTGGSTIEYFLVVTGAERGHIWIDDRGGDYGLWPLVIHEGHISENYGYLSDNDFAALPRVDFLAWYGRWLDAHIAYVKRWKGKYGSEKAT